MFPKASDPNSPALSPPEGTHSDFNKSNDGVHTVYIIVISVLLAISTSLLCAYVYTRFLVIKKHGPEDYTLCLAWAILAAFCGVNIPGYYAGFGKHQWNIPLQDIGDVIYWFNVATILYDYGFMMLKISIVTQYRSIFSPLGRKGFIWWFSWLLTLLFIAFYMTTSFLNIFVCSPRERLWKPSIEGHCLNNHVIRYSSACFNAVTDFIIILMPQLAIRRLRLPKRQQLGLAIVFSIGGFASLCSCIRIYYAYLLSHAEDVSFVGLQFGLWCFAELGLGIICACLPVLPRFLQSTLYKSSLFQQLSTTIWKSMSCLSSCSKRTNASTIRPDKRRSRPEAFDGTSLESLNRLEDTRTWARANLESAGSGQKHIGCGILKTVDIEMRSETEAN